MLEKPESMMNSSQFTRDFSKKHAQALRDETAREIKETRNKHRNGSMTYEEIRESNDPNLISSYDNLKKNLWGKIFKSERYLSDKAMLDFAISNLEEKQMKVCLSEIKKKYNQKIVELMQQTPLTKEEQDELLSVESVSKMNLADYLSLANRLSGLYFSHVTRFGLRETVGVHSGGQGEVMDGFTPILESGRLGSLVNNILSESDYAKIIVRQDLLSLNDFTNLIDMPKDEVVRAFMNKFFEEELLADCPCPDRSSTHFGYNHVLEDYGAEANYMIYFYFPAEILTKNFQHDLNPERPRSSIKDKHNDQVIWNAEDGIPLDLGVVCIPENVPVDKISGSKYVMDKNGKPKICLECTNHLLDLDIVKEDFNETISKIINDLKKEKEICSRLCVVFNEIEFFDRPYVIEAATKFGFMEIEKKLISDDKEYAYGCKEDSFESEAMFVPQNSGFNKEEMAYFKKKNTMLFRRFISSDLYSLLTPYDKLLNFYSNSEIYQRFSDKSVFRLFLERPSKENTISSHEYWENYFDKNPKARPSKILYYDLAAPFTGPEFQDKPLLKTEYYRINEDEKGAPYKDLISNSQFKDGIPETQEFWDKYGVGKGQYSRSYNRSKYLEDAKRFPKDYLDFWKRVEPKIIDFVGKVYDEIKAERE